MTGKIEMSYLLLPKLGIILETIPSLQNWCRRLMERDAWRKTQLSLEDFEAFKRRVKVLVKLRRRTLIRESSVKR